MVNYEFSIRLLRSFLGHSLKGNIFIGEIPPHILTELNTLTSVNAVVSIVHADSSYEVILEGESEDSNDIFSSFLDHLRNSGWVEVEGENSQSRRSFTDSESQRLFSIKRLDGEKTLYWITSRKKLPVRLGAFKYPQINIPESYDVLSPPNIKFDFKCSQQSLHKVSTEADSLEVIILQTDLSISQLSAKYTDQLEQMKWEICHVASNNISHASNWICTIGENTSNHLTLSISSLDAHDKFMVTLSVQNVSWSNYLYPLVQPSNALQRNFESISTDLLQKIIKVFQEDVISLDLTSENDVGEHLPIELPSGSIFVGSALINSETTKIFTDFPLNGLQSSSHIMESFKALRWEPLSVLPFRSGKGFIDSGFNFAFPNFFFLSSVENGDKQISVRTFPLLGQWTDVEIDYGPKTFEVASVNELDSLRETYLEYPFLPSFQPYEDSLVEHTNEFLNHGLFFSQAHLQSTSDIETLIAHYKMQLSISGEWEEISSSRDHRLFVSDWTAKDRDNKIWSGTFLLADTKKNSQDYLLQFIAFQHDKQKSKKQSFFERIIGKTDLG
jgi:hypothetical protein